MTLPPLPTPAIDRDESKRGCLRPATWFLCHGPAPLDYTLSCGSHISALMSDNTESISAWNSDDGKPVPCCYIGDDVETDDERDRRRGYTDAELKQSVERLTSLPVTSKSPRPPLASPVEGEAVALSAKVEDLIACLAMNAIELGYIGLPREYAVIFIPEHEGWFIEHDGVRGSESWVDAEQAVRAALARAGKYLGRQS